MKSTAVNPPRKKTRRRYRCLTREKAARTITVCSACYRASCWQGKRFCDEHRGAFTVQATRMELALLNLEHRDHWKAPATE